MTPHPRDTGCTFGPFYLDTDEGVLRKSGKEVALRPLALAVLAVLVKDKDKLLPYAELKEKAWGADTRVEPHTLSETVLDVRKVLGEYKVCIENKPKRGYRFDSRALQRVEKKRREGSLQGGAEKKRKSVAVRQEFHRFRRTRSTRKKGHPIDLARGLVAHYPLTKAKKAGDDSEKKNHGQKWVDVTFDESGTHFNGATSFISVPDSDSLRVSSFTFAAWICLRNLRGCRRIFEKGPSRSYWLYVHDKAPVVGFYWGRRYFNVESPFHLERNAWYHVAGTFDGRSLRLYLDGRCVDKNVIQEPSHPEHVRGPLTIGWKDGGIKSDHFCGEMKDLRIYNRALAAPEIRALYFNESSQSSGHAENTLPDQQ
jgi:DNA-binding winged helix-turn-helix (wHTH) protein